MIVVPTDTPGYEILRNVKVMGQREGHCEVDYQGVRVPAENLLGPRGGGFKIAQQRLGPGRIFHCMRWLGQAQRAFCAVRISFAMSSSLRALASAMEGRAI